MEKRGNGASAREGQGQTRKEALADTQLIGELTDMVCEAARAILAVDSGALTVRLKADQSPVTAADYVAQTVILAGLARLLPGVPVVSEEVAERPQSLPATFVLVDPLDGTTEFIAGRNEYTVNVAIIRNRAPAIGIVAAPALGLLWRGAAGRCAQRLRFSQTEASDPLEIASIHTRPWPQDRPVATVSRSHFDPQTRGFLARFGQVEQLVCGSALKLVRVAEGTADLYPRLAPTSEWDIAAGHAVIIAAGGAVTMPDGNPLLYGRPDQNFIIPGFIACGDPKAPVFPPAP